MGFFLFYLYRFFASERGTDKEEDCAPLLRGWFPRFFFFDLDANLYNKMLAWNRLAEGKKKKNAQ